MPIGTKNLIISASNLTTESIYLFFRILTKKKGCCYYIRVRKCETYYLGAKELRRPLITISELLQNIKLFPSWTFPNRQHKNQFNLPFDKGKRKRSPAPITDANLGPTRRTTRQRVVDEAAAAEVGSLTNFYLEFWNRNDERELQDTSPKEVTAWASTRFMYDIDLPDLVPRSLREYKEWKTGPKTLPENTLEVLMMIMKLDAFICHSNQPDYTRKQQLDSLKWTMRKMVSMRHQWAFPENNVNDGLDVNDLITLIVGRNDTHDVYKIINDLHKKFAGQALDVEQLFEDLGHYGELPKSWRFLSSLTPENWQSRFCTRQREVKFLTMGDMRALAACWDDFIDTPEGKSDYPDAGKSDDAKTLPHQLRSNGAEAGKRRVTEKVLGYKRDWLIRSREQRAASRENKHNERLKGSNDNASADPNLKNEPQQVENQHRREHRQLVNNEQADEVIKEEEVEEQGVDGMEGLVKGPG